MRVDVVERVHRFTVTPPRDEPVVYGEGQLEGIHLDDEAVCLPQELGPSLVSLAKLVHHLDEVGPPVEPDLPLVLVVVLALGDEPHQRGKLRDTLFKVSQRTRGHTWVN